ncbi:accessory Sec system protein Asp2 [Lactobacillus agrestimuris]|uniref:accessory Sec system protein Asp2 n=1 Tax=Lactobacillus agrestimuris TaxID=2941328 RepID=UPI0020442617|nr:accessory Sec system protein Asp2 [Lactobacillus agrestimuris]
MRVLQLGEQNWKELYQIENDLEWHFNDFAEFYQKEINSDNEKGNNKARQKNFDVVIITGKNNMSSQDWEKLHSLVLSHHVLYMPDVIENIDESTNYFLKSLSAQPISEEPQELINKLLGRYFGGQSGLRIFPTELMLNSQVITDFEYVDAGHLKLNLDTNNEWISIGTYKSNLYIDPNKLINFWLSMKNNNFEVRLRIFTQDWGTSESVKDQRLLNLDTYDQDDYYSQLKIAKKARISSINIEVKGSGDLTIGIFHSRWGRDGIGILMPGGERIIDPVNRDDIAYLFNRGDMKPPLNVYFSGAREKEGFEGFYLFNNLQAPSLLFTDMRLSVGAFYDDKSGYIGKEIKRVINEKLAELGFDSSQLVMNGISMGTYPALKYGAQLQAYAINVAKPLTNLGYISTRMALERPDEFETICDIDNNLVDSLNKKELQKLDEKFWQEFNRQDLSKTRLFVGYMKNDDYDDHAIQDLSESPVVKKSLQFSTQGFTGRHNDDPMVNNWFIARLNEILKDFGREKS